VYYAQRAFQAKNKRWAKLLDELGLADLMDPSVVGPVRLETTGSMFEASAQPKNAATGQQGACAGI